MSGSKSPALSPSAEKNNSNGNKSMPTQSSGDSSSSPQHNPETTTTEVTTIVKEETKVTEDEDKITNLTRKQTKWVFAATCYAYGVLSRDFSAPIDDELLAIIKNKLDDEPGFHNDTLDFGNNPFHDKLDSVVRETWDLFLDQAEDSSSHLLDSLDTTQQSCDSNDIVDHQNMNQINDFGESQQQACIKSVSTDDQRASNAASSMDQHNKTATTPNSSSGGDSVSLANTNELMMHCDGGQQQKRKVYLGGLSDEIDEDDLKEYFKEYGTIVDINIVLHKDTGKRRGFAFVEYDDHEAVDKIVSKKFHTIKNRRIEAKKAIPKIEMDARKRVDQRVQLCDQAMMLLRGHSAASYLWDGFSSTYAGSGAHVALHHGAPPPPPLHGPPPPLPGSHAAAYHNHLDHHHHSQHYTHHYHPSAAAHYGSGSSAATAASWLLPSGAGCVGHPGSARGVAANGYGSSGGSSGQSANSGSSWATANMAAVTAAADYGRMPIEAIATGAAVSNGGIGPTRTPSYGQHARSYRPYASGSGASGGQRARSFK